MRKLHGAAIVLMVVWFSSSATAQVGNKPASKAPVQSAVARLNVTGAWDGNFWGGRVFSLPRKATAWGKFTHGNGDGFACGSWRDGRLMPTLTQPPRRWAACAIRGKFSSFRQKARSHGSIRSGSIS